MSPSVSHAGEGEVSDPPAQVAVHVDLSWPLLGLARIRHGLQERLYLGNLDARRDWGYAPDYVEAMWLMLQAERPDDYVVATGEAHSVRELCELAFARVGLSLEWRGEGIDEKGYDVAGICRVEIDPRYFRPAEVDELLGDAGKARRELGWEPGVGFARLVEIMVEADLALVAEEALLAAPR